MVKKIFEDYPEVADDCEFICEWRKNNKTSGIGFNYLIEEFEGRDHRILIENIS